jgi:hypothetical protein
MIIFGSFPCIAAAMEPGRASAIFLLSASPGRSLFKGNILSVKPVPYFHGPVPLALHENR